MYYLSSSMSDRINYDDHIRSFAEELITSSYQAGGQQYLDENTSESVATYHWSIALANGEEDNVDDLEEAKARFFAVFDEVYQTFLTTLP